MQALKGWCWPDEAKHAPIVCIQGSIGKLNPPWLQECTWHQALAVTLP